MVMRASRQPSQAEHDKWMDEVKVEWNKRMKQEEGRRGGVESGKEGLIQGWITGWATAVQCWAEAHWVKCSGPLVSVKLSFSLKTFISANLINGWWIKTLHNVPSSNVSGCAETFFWIRTWAQNSFSSSQTFNIRSSLRGNGWFWIATVAHSNSP